jgi:hypothetical protein
MTDTPEQSGDEAGASETPSENSNTDIEAVVSRLLASQNDALDKRLQGFQSLIDRKMTPLSQDLETLKAALSPETQEQYDQSRTEKELEELRRFKQVMESRKGHEDAVDFFMEAMGKDSFEEQIAFIEQRLGSKAPTQEPAQPSTEEAVSEPVPAVDANNPSRSGGPRLGASAAVEQGGMDDRKADAILAAGNQKGALATLRRAIGGS